MDTWPFTDLPDVPDLPARLRMLRERAGFSQEQLARRVNRSQVWISRRETGATRLKPDEIAEIAEACGYRAEVIFLPDGSGGGELAGLLAVVSPDDAITIAALLRALPRMDSGMRSFVLGQLRFAAEHADR